MIADLSVHRSPHQKLRLIKARDLQGVAPLDSASKGLSLRYPLRKKPFLSRAVYSRVASY